MKEIMHHLSIKMTEKPYTITFCPITGMDIPKYNNENSKHVEQDTLDEIVEGINQTIIGYNWANHVLTPWLASDIHYNKKGGRRKTRYYKLADDGLHLGDQMKEKSASILYTTIVRMFEDPPQ